MTGWEMPSWKPNGSLLPASSVSRTVTCPMPAASICLASSACLAPRTLGELAYRRIRPSIGGSCGPPQAQQCGSDSPTSPRKRLRFGPVIPPRNWGENPVITLSGRPRRRRPAGVYATCRALSPENLPAGVTRGSSQDSSAWAAAGSGAVKIVNRACRRVRYPRAIRPWMSSRSSLTATVASQEREPALSLCRAHVPAQARPDLGVVLDVVGAELRVGGVPRGHRYLITADGGLELLFELGAAEKQPPGRRVVPGAAERGVQAPPDDVDEVVVIGLDGAVVVGSEGHPLPAVDRNPPGEMDRLDSGEAVVGEDVPDPVVGEEHHRAGGQLPEPAGLQEADHREWVLRDEVLVVGNLFEVTQRRPLGEGLVVALVQPEQHGPDRQDEEQHRQERQENQGHGHHVHGLADAEAQGRRRWWLPRPGQAGASGDVRAQFPAYLGGGAAGPVALVEIVLQRIAQRRLLADLLEPAPHRVHVEGAGGDHVPAQPGDPGPAVSIRAGIARAVSEGLVDALSGQVDELGQVAPQRRVHLAHENERGRNLLAVGVRRLVKEVELGEVEPVQVTEVERPLGEALARDFREPVAQFGYPARGDLRPDRDAQLMRHGNLPPLSPAWR